MGRGCIGPDKARLVAEAKLLVRPGGTIAFTDWVEGSAELKAEEAQRALGLMSFPNVHDIPGYSGLLRDNGCDVLIAEDTGRMTAFFDLSLNMTEIQVTYEYLRRCNFGPRR